MEVLLYHKENAPTWLLPYSFRWFHSFSGPTARVLTRILSVHLKKQMRIEGETEGVDSVWLTVRGYSLAWGEEGIMQDSTGWLHKCHLVKKT
jgi:hypothetical protein